MVSRDWAVQRIHECIVGCPCRFCPARNLGLHAIKLMAGKRRGGTALSATCGATRRRQMRDVRYDRDASGDDQNQRKDYCYLFYNRGRLFMRPTLLEPARFRDRLCVN